VWAHTHWFWGDERYVPPDHPDSNYGMAREALGFDPLRAVQRIHRIPTEYPDAPQAANAYEQHLRAFFHLQPGEWPRFDLVLLGLGADGHVASLFPQSATLEERERLVVVDRPRGQEQYRISLILPVFNAAANIMFLVGGVSKAFALQQTLEGDYRPARYPAQSLRPTQGRVVWLVDAAAATGLRHHPAGSEESHRSNGGLASS
jgi:6-phosphogluconolactonase